MINLIGLTFKSILLDRIFHGIICAALLFLFVPIVASLSMQQAVEIATTLSLSIFAAILLILSIFLGGTSLWRDIERRYTFSILSLPIGKNSYILGKFLGVTAFMMFVALTLGVIVSGEVWLVAKLYAPTRQVAFGGIVTAVFFLTLKYILLVACTFMLSSFSTSFFLPIFGAASIWLAGGAIQQVHDYIMSDQSAGIIPVVKMSVSLVYYLLPNFSAFDLTSNAVYALPLSLKGLSLTFFYFLLYTAVVITLTSIFFSKRELK